MIRSVARRPLNEIKSTQALPVVLLVVAILVAPWIHGGTFDAWRYGLASLLLIATAVSLHQPGRLDNAVGPPVLACAVWSLASAPIVAAATRASESVMVLAAGLAAFLLARDAAREESRGRALALAVLLVGSAQAAFGVVQAHVAPGALYGLAIDGVASPYGSFENHNHFAGLLEMSALLCLALAFGRARRAGGVEPLSIAFGGGSFALAGAHLASRSRGGLLALVAGTVALLVLWRLAGAKRAPGRREWAAAGLMAVALLGFGWAAVPPATRAHLATAFRGPTDASGSYRLSVGAATLRLWWENPIFGCGLGNYADEVTRFKRSDGLVGTRHAESDVLEFAAEGGILGLALVGWLGASVVAGFRDRMREGRDPWRKSMAVGALAAVIALLTHSFFDFNLRIPSNALVFSALLGLAAAPKTAPPPAPRWLARLVSVLFLILGVAAGWRTVGAFELRTARRAETADDRLRRLSGVLSRHPYLVEAWRDRAHLRWRLARGNREMEAYRFQGAAEDMERVLQLRPHMSSAWADMGWLRYLRGDVTGARAAFERAARLDPANVAIGLARTDFFARTNETERAQQELLSIRSYNPDWPEASAKAAAARFGIDLLK